MPSSEIWAGMKADPLARKVPILSGKLLAASPPVISAFAAGAEIKGVISTMIRTNLSKSRNLKALPADTRPRLVRTRELFDVPQTTRVGMLNRYQQFKADVAARAKEGRRDAEDD